MVDHFDDRELKQLLYLFKCGSIPARNDLVVALLPLLKSVANKILAKPWSDTFDDLVQDSAMYLLRVLEKFQLDRPNVKLTTWVTVVAQNRMRNYIRLMRQTKNGLTVVVRDFSSLSLREKESASFKKKHLLDPDFIDLAKVKPDTTMESAEVFQASQDLFSALLVGVKRKDQKVLAALLKGEKLRELPEFAGESRAYCSFRKKQAVLAARRLAKRHYREKFQSLSDSWKAC